MLDKPQAIILTESNPDYTCISSDGWEDIVDQIDGLVQGRRNSIANAQELRLSCTKASRWGTKMMLYELTGKRWSRYTISYTSLAWSKIYVTPVCWRYSYIAFALSHCYIPVKIFIMLCCHPIGPADQPFPWLLSVPLKAPATHTRWMSSGLFQYISKWTLQSMTITSWLYIILPCS